MTDDTVDETKATAWASSALNSMRDLAAYNLVATKLDIALLQIALISDAHKPHLTPEKRQEALDALGKLEAYRDQRQAFIDDGKLQFAHVCKSQVAIIDILDCGTGARHRRSKHLRAHRT